MFGFYFFIFFLNNKQCLLNIFTQTIAWKDKLSKLTVYSPILQYYFFRVIMKILIWQVNVRSLDTVSELREHSTLSDEIYKIPQVSPKESGKYYSFPVNTDDTRNFFFIFLRLKGGRDEKVRLGRGKVLEEVKIKFSWTLPPSQVLSCGLFICW